MSFDSKTPKDFGLDSRDHLTMMNNQDASHKTFKSPVNSNQTKFRRHKGDKSTKLILNKDLKETDEARFSKMQMIYNSRSPKETVATDRTQKVVYRGNKSVESLGETAFKICITETSLDQAFDHS